MGAIYEQSWRIERLIQRLNMGINFEEEVERREEDG